MNRLAILFDLDHTLFDTTALKSDLFAALRNAGVPETLVALSFDSFISAHEGNYDLDEHCAHIRRAGIPCAPENIRLLLGASFEKYLIEGTRETLSELRARQHLLILITKGYASFQREKIRRSNLDKFFDAISVCRKWKEEELKKFSLPFGSYFINDNWEETERIMRSYPTFHYLLFSDANSRDSSPPHISIPTITRLPQILDIIP